MSVLNSKNHAVVTLVTSKGRFAKSPLLDSKVLYFTQNAF